MNGDENSALVDEEASDGHGEADGSDDDLYARRPENRNEIPSNSNGKSASRQEIKH